VSNFYGDIFDKNYNGPPKVIAEISANHSGSIDKMIQSILVAKSVGCDAVKIQTYTAETMTLDCDRPEFMVGEGLWKGKTLFQLYKQGETPYEWHSELFNLSKQIDFPLFSTPFDETAVDLLESLGASVYKVGSPELCDLPLIEYIAQTGKPLILSTGMAQLHDIDQAVKICKKYNIQFLLLHCVSSYPTNIVDSQIYNIKFLAEKYLCPVGLSDHTLSNTTSVLATALGARFIEKHFTLDKFDGGIDNEFSLDPEQMTNLVEEVHNAYMAMGIQDKFIKSVEATRNRKYMRSLYFVKDLKVGDIVKAGDIKKVRPGLGMPCSEYNNVIGRVLAKSVRYGEPVSSQSFMINEKYKSNDG
jgi:N-acetylneuraminate synthase